MRLSRFTIIYMCIFICFMTITHLKIIYAKENVLCQIMYNQIFDTAMEDALNNNIEYDYYNGFVCENKEKIVEEFFENVVYNFNEYNDFVTNGIIRDCFRVLIIAESDGLYTYSNNSFGEKVYYTDVCGGYNIKYTIGEYSTITMAGKDIKKSDRDMAYMLNMTEEEYEDREMRIIADTIRRELENVVNRGDRHYSISIPYSDLEEWYKCAYGISLYAFYDGRELGIDGFDYCRVIFSGARLEK